MATSETAWLEGWLVVRNQTLASVVDAIRPYRNGIVRLDSAVAGLRVSGAGGEARAVTSVIAWLESSQSTCRQRKRHPDGMRLVSPDATW